jgi:5-methylcytosine-specific restriction enzyme subunit McrC
MRSRYLTAFEHEPIPVSDEGTESGLTSAEAEYLAFLGQLRPGFCERGHGSVRLAQYCGVVSLGDRVLEILPKIDESRPAEECRGVLLRLLRESEQFPLFRHLSVGQHLRRAPLLEVFIAAFFDAITAIVRGGLLRQYREREEDLQVVRGCIVASRQFAVHSNRSDRVACRFDELTADNTWNRLIKAGLRAVRPWIASVELNRRWVELMVVFDEVDDARADACALDRLVFDRHAVRYRTAIDWVRWILALLSPALRAGRHGAPGLLFDMNSLFQSAVASVLRRRAEAGFGVRVQSQVAGRHLALVRGSGGRRAFGLRPDLLVRSGTGFVAVGDTKWKRLGVSQSGYLMPTEADIYQLLAYGAAFECEHLALIYPWHSGLAGSEETTFELPPVGTLQPVASVMCVDLHNDSFRLVRGQGMSEFSTLLLA